MAKAPARSTYAKLVGEIAIGWNAIEREMNNVAFHYMKDDPTVAGFILASMGNVTKADFLVLLAKTQEANLDGKQAVLHFAALCNRLRENRNILEHGIPALTYDERYLGHVYKLDKSSNFKAFQAPIGLLEELRAAMREVQSFARGLRAALHMLDVRASKDDDERIGELLLESLPRPTIPRKLDPLELP